MGLTPAPDNQSDKIAQERISMKRKIKVGRFRARARNFDRQTVNSSMYISILAILVGVVAGYGAIAFRYMIAFFHNLFFMGTLDFHFASDHHFTSSWGAGVILVPALGMLIVNWLTQTFAPEAKGHGVPEVMNAVVENRGKIRPVVALVKSLASAISIGSGGSVGREGPIVQIGSSFGSSLGQFLGLRPRDVILLVGCGVAGGIAATFNAPIGGIAFAIELILPEYSLMTFMPLIISATTATYIASIYIGSMPAFILPEYHLVSPVEFIFYLILGVMAAGGSIAFISILYRTEDFFDHIRISSHIKALAGGLLLGAIGYLLYRTTGQYYLFGVGYSFITDMLTSVQPGLLLILLLIGLKIFATSLTLGAGGSGGVFAPSLFLGAAIGGATGMVFHHFFPAVTAPASAYALVGMAAMVAGTTGATLTAIVMTFEMTRNYEIMLPLMLSIVLANYLVRVVYSETIYTKKLSRRGINIQFDKRISIFKMTPVSATMDSNIVSVQPSDTVADVLAKAAATNMGTFPVIQDGKVLGLVACATLYSKDRNETIASSVMERNIVLPASVDSMTALEKMDAADSNLLVLQSESGLVGVVTKRAILREYFRKKRMIM